MRVKIFKGTAKGTVAAPPSKSMAHRALICGALGKETSLVKGIEFSEDIKATLNCLIRLGAEVRVEGDVVSVGRLNFDTIPDNISLDCNESGSTLRFLIPLALLSGKRITFCGSRRLFQRPLNIYREICQAKGFVFEQSADSLTVCGRLTGGEFTVPGDVSSQFISGLLFALPLAEGDSVINITGNLESGSYIDLTLISLEDSGIEIGRPNPATFLIKGNQHYKAANIKVEGDYSNAAFFDFFNLAGGDVKITGLRLDSAQGDRVYKDLFESLKCSCPAIDIADCPDLGPVLMAAAATLNGAVLTGTKRLKIKESDRGNAMAAELNKFGVPVVVEENRIIVKKAAITPPKEAICGHNDHRIVMAAAVLCTLTGGEIDGAEAVAKSLPDFFYRIKQLGIKVESYEA